VWENPRALCPAGHRKPVPCALPPAVACQTAFAPAIVAPQAKACVLGASGPVFTSPRPVSSATLYGQRGIIGHQDKQMMTGFEHETWNVVVGTGPSPFDTDLGRIGVVICYDSEVSLLAQSLVESRVETFLAPSCTDSLAGFTRVRVASMARALENQCGVVQSPTVGMCDFCPAVDET
jgi:predicted amidohydrolase